MKNLMRIVAMVAILAMVLCGCGSQEPADSTGTTGSDPVETTTAPAPTGTTAAPTVDDGKVTYTVTVVDQNKNPVVGAVLQFCDDETCKLPVATDENGVVSQSYPESNYHVTVVELPAGFTTEETEFYFEVNSTELNIVVSAALN